MKYSEIFTKARMEKGLTQEALAERLQIHQTTVGNVEAGIRFYGRLTLMDACDVLGLDVAEMWNMAFAEWRASIKPPRKAREAK